MIRAIAFCREVNSDEGPFAQNVDFSYKILVSGNEITFTFRVLNTILARSAPLGKAALMESGLELKC